jgi:formylglycine-generating enzyme required for sulfatase activity
MVCESLFFSSEEINAIVEEVARMSLAIQLQPSLYTDPVQVMRVSTLVNQELAHLEKLDPEILHQYFITVKKLRSQFNKVEDEAMQLREKKIREQQRAIDMTQYETHLVFHDIRPGVFLMGEVGKEVPTEIRKPFAMMATPMTQYVWAALKIAMGEKNLNQINPSSNKYGLGSTIESIDGFEIKMKAGHPVEQVTWKQSIQFVKDLTRLSKNGDEKIQALLQKLIPGHRRGDHYDLLTEAQWEFVGEDRGNANEKYFDRNDDLDLDLYAWYSNNSDNQTHPVATKKPRLIDGKSYYDFEGNVWEWTKDRWDGSSPLPGGVDPLGVSGLLRVFRSSAFSTDAKSMQSSERRGASQDFVRSLIGLRLIRTRK